MTTGPGHAAPGPLSDAGIYSVLAFGAGTADALPLPSATGRDRRIPPTAGLRAEDLADETLIELSPDSLMGSILHTVMPPGQRRRPVRVRVNAWLNALSLVRRGFGVTLGPRFDADYYPPGIDRAFFRAPPVVEAAIVIAPRSPHRDAIDEFVDAYLDLTRSQMDSAAQ